MNSELLVTEGRFYEDRSFYKLLLAHSEFVGFYGFLLWC